MPLLFTPPYMAVLGATVLFLGTGEDSPSWMSTGAVSMLAAAGAALVGASRRQWIHRMRSDSYPIRAKVTGVVSAPIKLNGREPYRLVCRGLTPPAVGRTFRGGWMATSSEASPPSVVTVMLDPRRPARYLVDVEGARPARPLLQRVLRHLGALGLVLASAFVELVGINVVRPEAPLGPVHGDVQANGAHFGKGGLHLRPDLCRVATNPGVTAVALLRRDDAYPVAWIITDSSSRVAAIDVKESSSAQTVRFSADACTRLHGDISKVGRPAPPPSLAGYADAECRGEGGELTLHIDFGDCR